MLDGPLDLAVPTIEMVLTRRGSLSGAALDRARRLEAESGECIDHIAAKLGMISDTDLAAAYAELLGATVLISADFPTVPMAIDGLQKTFLKTARIIPIAMHAEGLTIAKGGWSASCASHVAKPAAQVFGQGCSTLSTDAPLG